MEIKLGVSRFRNIDGVSCYMVSILHILQQISSFRKFIKSNKFINNNDSVIYELSKIIKTSLNNDNIKISPNSFKKIMSKKNSMWGEMEHQDSQEFYIYLITKIEEECGQQIYYLPKIIENNENNNNLIKKNILQLLALSYIQRSEIKDYSPIKKIFIGYLISNTSCCYCLTNSPCFESFITLPLDRMIKDEKLDKYNKLTCDICGLKNQSIKRVQIWKAPQILVIQLKRFVMNDYGVQTTKIMNPVIYPVNDFDISEYFHPESIHKENAIYNLIGINIHREMNIGSINAGHYISIIKNIYNNKWYIFDDDKEPRELNENEIQNRNAYLLFYYKNN